MSVLLAIQPEAAQPPILAHKNYEITQSGRDKRILFYALQMNKRLIWS
jgi:hypothetical protein